MKIIKRLSMVIMAFLIIFSATACRRPTNDEDQNAKDKTTLSIGVFDGGLGSDWVYAIKKKFEEKYADAVLEPGKKGVHIKVVPSRSFTTTGMDNNMENMKEEIIFAEGATANFFAARGDFLDISDVATMPLNYDFVTKKVSEGGESATIESKLKPSQVRYFTSLGAYYALPSTEKFYGIAYDMELFEENNLYFKKGGGFITDKNDTKDVGPDGEPNTYDDGLPATYEDFATLCAKILSLKITPIMWGGTVQEYVSDLLTALAADYAGAAQAELNYGFNGTLTSPIESFDASGNPVFGDDVEITADKGYHMYKAAGRYYALKFLENIIKNGYYNTSNATSGNFTHQDAEGVFVAAKYNKNMKRAAMLIDGVWWQSEAKQVFNDLAAEKGEEASMKNRKFGLMPLPKVDREHLGEYTVLSLTGDIAFINSKISSSKIDIAKAFLQYCYTNEGCVEYTKQTNVCRPVTFDMGDAYNELSSWGKDVVDIHNNAVKAYQDNESKIMTNYSTDLWYAPNLWLSTINGKTHTYPSKAMIDDGVSAKDYFVGLSKYWTEQVWKTKFKNV